MVRLSSQTVIYCILGVNLDTQQKFIGNHFFEELKNGKYHMHLAIITQYLSLSLALCTASTSICVLYDKLHSLRNTGKRRLGYLKPETFCTQFNMILIMKKCQRCLNTKLYL